MQSAAQAAASSATFPLIGRVRGFAPVIDGITLPRDPFNPTAPEISADIPVMIGTTRTEATLFVMNVPGITQIDWAGAEKWMTPILKERTAPAMALYRRRNPSASPYDVLVDMLTQAGGRAGDIRLAERKIAQRAAPVWVYRLDWKTPAMGGVLKSPHALDLPLVFDNTDKLPILMGTGPEAKIVARQMASTWIAFARNGNPDNPTVPHWPAYSLKERNVMLFDVKSTVARDPDSEERQFWAE
jgi:para-nitrobenzyl esterase